MDHTPPLTRRKMGKGKKKRNNNKDQRDRNGGRRAGFGHMSKREQKKLMEAAAKQGDRFIHSLDGAFSAASTKKNKNKNKKKKKYVPVQLSMKIGRGNPKRKKVASAAAGVTAASSAATSTATSEKEMLLMQATNALHEIAHLLHPNYGKGTAGASAASAEAGAAESVEAGAPTSVDEAHKMVLERARSLDPGLADFLKRIMDTRKLARENQNHPYDDDDDDF